MLPAPPAVTIRVRECTLLFEMLPIFGKPLHTRSDKVLRFSGGRLAGGMQQERANETGRAGATNTDPSLTTLNQED